MARGGGIPQKKTTMYHQDAPNETKDADILHTPRQAAENRDTITINNKIQEGGREWSPGQ